MKTCSKCGEAKPLAEFHKEKRGAFGVMSKCKPCVALLLKAWREANPEKVRAQAKRHRESNPEVHRERARKRGYETYRSNRKKILAGAKRYYAANAGAVKTRIMEYRQKHRDKVAPRDRERCVKRRAASARAFVAWADRKVMRRLYAMADRLSKETGRAWHVDHIVPLQHPVVCGLHCPANLQLLPAAENLSKGNRHWPDMPDI